MNENIDVRMSNFLTILGNPQLCKNFDTDVIRNMKKSVAIYATTKSSEYIEEYRRQQEAQQRRDEVTKMFK